MKKNYDIDKSSLVNVPATVAVCPYCKDELSITGVDAWIVEDDGGYTPEHIELECNSQPDYDAEDSIMSWFGKTHSDMPYVRWMPIEEKVMAWFKSQYNFVRPSREKELLEKWIKSCVGSSK